jgi:hypothetical protein
VATITNTGDYPSVFGSLRAVADYKGAKYNGRLYVTGKDFTVTMPANGNIPAITELFPNNEHLGLKGAVPIPQGGMTQGFLLCDFSNLDQAAAADRFSLTLSFRDILGNEGTATVTTGGTKMDALQVYPGLKTKIGGADSVGAGGATAGAEVK